MKKHQKDKPSVIVKLNGREVCRAGVCGDGIVDASLKIMKLNPPGDDKIKDVSFHVGGIFDKEYYTWFHDMNLKVGDKVTLEIVELDGIDEPQEISDIDDLILNPAWWMFWKRRKVKDCNKKSWWIS